MLDIPNVKHLSHVPTPVLSASVNADIMTVISYFKDNTGRHNAQHFSNCMSTFHRHNKTVWSIMKSVRFPPDIRQYSTLTNKAVFGRPKVYGKHNRHDGVKFRHGSWSLAGILVQLLLLYSSSPMDGNRLVTERFGHERFKFAVSNAGNIHTVLQCRCFPQVVLIKSRDLLQPKMLLIDP